jgi:TolB-like protein
VNLSGWYAELRRRRVFRAVLAYGIASFAILQVVEPVMHGLHLPDTVLSVVVVLLGLGFPVLILLAWAFDLKPTGIERTRPVGAGVLAVASGPVPGPGPVTAGNRAAVVIALVALGLAIAAPGLTWFFLLRPRFLASAFAATQASGPSVAVLPFADLSPGKDQGYLADGIAEDILSALAQVDGLRAPGRTSSFWFKDKSARLDEIGRDLKVRTVLEGSVRRDGNRIRVTAQLLDVANGYQLWSETYERDLDDVFRVQSDIAQAVADALKVQLLSGPPSTRGRKPRIEAYEQFLLGRQLRSTGTPASILAARGAFERAVAIDPGFAAAHVALARTHGDVAGLLARSPEEVTASAMRELASAEMAIRLDPRLPEAWLARASHRLSYAWDWKGALEDAERARALGAKPPADGLVGALAAAGRYAEALALARKGVDRDPLSESAWGTLGFMLSQIGDGAGAEAAARRALQIAPDRGETADLLGVALLQQGRLDEARAVFERNPFPFMRLSGLAIVLHAMGRQEESQAALDELVRDQSLIAAFQIAEVHAARGEADQAFAWLERARRQHDEGIEHVYASPHLARLHGDPRWKPFLRTLNFPVDEDRGDPRNH